MAVSEGADPERPA